MFFLIIGLSFGNSLVNILKDTSQFAIILICFVSMYSVRVSDLERVTIHVAHFSMVLSTFFIIFDAKMQTSYSSFIALIYFLLIISRFQIKWWLIFLFPIVSYSAFLALYGKSVIVCSVFLCIFLIFHRKNINFSFIVRSCLSILILTMSIFLFWPVLITSGAITKTLLFFAHFNVIDMEFDVSTGQRILEIVQVWNSVTKSAFTLLFGYGSGGSIDLSMTLDSAVVSSHDNLKEVRNIHALPFYILLKYGLVGCVFFYFASIRFLLKIRELYFLSEFSKFDLLPIKALILYCVFIFIDSHFSAGHMLSNPLFWCSLFLLLRLAKERL